MAFLRIRLLRPALAAVILVIIGALWVAGKANAAELQDEAAQPYIFTASLEAQLDPLGEDTSCQVEYTTVAAFEANGWNGAEAVACSPADIDSAEPAQRVTAKIPGLSSDTEYRYRFVATAAASVEGPGGTFHTFGVESFTAEAIGPPPGEPDSAAGSHPFEFVTRVTLPHGEVRGSFGAAALAKTILAELPPGLVGNPTAAEVCPTRLAEERRCSGDSQVGFMKVRSVGPQVNLFETQVFNVTPAKGSPGRFGGQINLSTSAFIDAGLRSGEDYGINAGGFNLPTLTNPFIFEVRLWGVPADPAHDPLRSCFGAKAGCSVTPGTPKKPFLRNPTRCAGPLQARVKVETYDLPGTIFSRGFEMPAITGCDQLEFKPQLEARPTSDVADSPTGLHVDLHVPQNEDPEGLATPDLRNAVVKLPPGLTLNPSSAAGLEGCTPGQIGLTTPVGTTPIRTTPGPAQCPDAAKIGTVEVDTPLLGHPLPGAVYVATPYENPFDSLLAIYIAVHDAESGVVIKLAGHVEIGPEGQLTTTFSENPQLPFEHFRLDFFGGPRAALKTPAVCGTYSTTSTLTPWSAPQSGPPARPGDSYEIARSPRGGACPRSPGDLPNSPSFEAGSASAIAGSYAPFLARFAREDGSQEFDSLSVSPPPGLLAKLAGVPYCPEAALAAVAQKSGRGEQASPSCPAASQVGTVVVGAGAGPSPYYVTGHAYLAGPYKGAPLSLAVITPAVAGPYDLGAVLVRTALAIDPRTAEVTAVSDRIPRELKGIPLDVRSIAVRLDRPDFALNPTSCEAMSVGGSLLSTLGNSAALSNRFQLGECRRLGFKPKLSLRLKGKTKRTGFPALRAVYAPRKGDANLAGMVLRFPRSAFIEQAHFRTICTRVQFAAGDGMGTSCPKGSRYGHIRAVTPLLDEPLKGPVFLRSSNHNLPDVVFVLRGQVSAEVPVRIDSVKGGLRATIQKAPDVPLSKVVLRMQGGRKGLFVNSRNLCSRISVVHRNGKKVRRRLPVTYRARARLGAHNGDGRVLRPRMRASCPRRKAHRGHRGGRGRGHRAR